MSRAPAAGPKAGLPPAPARQGAGPHARALGQQLLIYTPDGPLGGTLTCVACAAQATQPDLLDHTPACPHRLATSALAPERR